MAFGHRGSGLQGLEFKVSRFSGLGFMIKGLAGSRRWSSESKVQRLQGSV